jgi:hypothetical protein
MQQKKWEPLQILDLEVVHQRFSYNEDGALAAIKQAYVLLCTF